MVGYEIISIVVIIDLISFETDYKLYRDPLKADQKKRETNYRNETGKSSRIAVLCNLFIFFAKKRI